MQLTQLVLSGAVTISMVAAINGIVVHPNTVSKSGPPGVERPHVVDSKWDLPGRYHLNERFINEPSRPVFHPPEPKAIKKIHVFSHAPSVVTRGIKTEEKLKNVPLVDGDPPWVGNYLRPATEPVPKWAQKETGSPHRAKQPKVGKIDARVEHSDRGAGQGEGHRKHEEAEHLKKEQHLKSLDESHHESHHLHTRIAEADAYADAEADAEAEALEVEGHLYGRGLEDEEHRKHEEEWMEHHPHRGHRREEYRGTHHHDAREANAEPYADPEAIADPESYADADADAYDPAERHYLYARGFNQWGDPAAW
ncbi:hypothetical protein MMC32_002285 [Xylographa parallela]|nr:hypothetical protein [Xylographa parallela]